MEPLTVGRDAINRDDSLVHNWRDDRTRELA
jgi:hypothetical protein